MESETKVIYAQRAGLGMGIICRRSVIEEKVLSMGALGLSKAMGSHVGYSMRSNEGYEWHCLFLTSQKHATGAKT